MTGLKDRAYSSTEVQSVYELARLFLEIGYVRRAEKILHGLVVVAPTFQPAWLALTYLYITAKDAESAVSAARAALKCDAQDPRAMLFLIGALLLSGDYNGAGTQLGEVKDRIESGEIDDPLIKRLFAAYVARFEMRPKQ